MLYFICKRLLKWRIMNNYRKNDFIFIDKLEVFAHHGVFSEETLNGQNFYISIKLYTDT